MSEDYLKYTSSAYNDHRSWWEKQARNFEGPLRWFEGLSASETPLVEHHFGKVLSEKWSGMVKGNPNGEFVIFLTGIQLLLRKVLRTNELAVLLPSPNGLSPFQINLANDATLKDCLSNTKQNWSDWTNYSESPYSIAFGEETSASDLSDFSLSYDKLYPNNAEKAAIHFELKKVGDCFAVEIHATLSVEKELLQTLCFGLEHLLENLNNTNTLISSMSTAPNVKPANQIKSEQFNFPQEKTIIQAFEEACSNFPYQTAIAHHGEELTYANLSEKVDLLAAHLIKKGIKTTDLVAVGIERSPNLIVGLLSILKAGATYVPIDAAYPKSRIEAILEDSKAPWLLCDVDFPEVDAAVQRIVHQVAKSSENEVQYPTISSNQTAYIIYTSGSTGTPKGVKVSHANLMSLFFHQDSPFDFSETEVWTLFHSYCFDFSVWEMYGALLFGGKLVLPNKETVLDTAAYAKLIAHEKVTILNTTPGAFYALSESLLQQEELSLETVIFGGEALQTERLTHFFDQAPHVSMINMYGITETTVHVTYKLLRASDLTSGKSLIGKALPSLSVVVLDQDYLPQIPGVPGEICIAGAGVSQGYLHNEDLSAAKFKDISGKRTYLSGDLGIYEKDELQYRGRIDQQVKIRGYRIEVGEVQHHVLQLDGISDAHIGTIRDDSAGINSLCAWVVSEKHQPETWDAALKNRLPNHMVPTFWVRMDQLPLTPNGKLDVKALPRPDSEILQSSIIPAETSTEQHLESIWRDVLGDLEYGKNAHFFHSGGNSLTATYLKARIQQAFHTDIPLTFIFGNPLLQDIAAAIDAATPSVFNALEKAPKLAHYPLSPGQWRMYLLHQFEGIGTTYNMPSTVRIAGKLDKNQLTKLLQTLAQQHASLRTSFHMVDGEPVQKVHEKVEINVNWHRCGMEEAEKVLNQAVQKFDLETAPLLHVTVCELSDTDHLLFFDVAHIISDGRSMEVLMGDFLALYQGKGLTPPKYDYTDYAWWLKQESGQKAMEKQAAYWLRKFRNLPERANLHTDFNRPAVQVFEGDSLTFKISDKTTKRLRALAGDQNATLYMVILTACYLWYYKYSRKKDLVIGTPTSGRGNADFEDVMGIFITILALRQEINPELSLKELLDEVKTNSIEAFDHQDYPFETLINGLDLQRDLSRNALFDVLFTFNDTSKTLKDSNTEGFSTYHHGFEVARFDLTITGEWNGDAIHMNFQYATSLFEKETVRQMTHQFENVLEQLAFQSNKPAKDLSLLSIENQISVRENSRGPALPLHNAHGFIGLFQEAVKNHPNKLAVSDGTTQLNYLQLFEKASGLAEALNVQNIGSGDVVAVISSASTPWVVAICGVLLSGATWLPIDPEYPEKRIRYMIEDSGSKAIITDYEAVSNNFDGPVLRLSQTYPTSAKKAFEPNMSSNAYLIYTSGSSGQPKGVLVPHKALSNFTHWYLDEFKVTENDVVTKYVGPSFDVTVGEVFPTLSAGGCLKIVPTEVKLDLNGLVNWLEQENVTHSFLPTAIFEQVCGKPIKGLQALFTGGEKLNFWGEAPYRTVNMYGPAEFTEVSTWFDTQDEKDVDIPIGWPIANSEVLILDDNGQLLPHGIPGELCVTGNSLSVGYINKPELTAKFYRSHPHFENKRVYHTGDLARRRKDGAIEYLGRIDRQVQIRGHRVEPGEVEHHLNSMPQISKGVVLVAEGKDKKPMLVAWYVSEEQLPSTDIRDYLKQHLTEAMMPSLFVHLDQVPLTPNGKTDQLALLSSDYLAGAEQQSEAEPPKNEHETRILEFWKALLPLESFGVTDNFFELGGNSIKLTLLFKKLESAYEGKFHIAHLFDKATVREQAALLEEKPSDSEPKETLKRLEF